ncbi:hypothetical protein ALC56_08570 [Trachymyrmex septentrionalis]|uniref:Uncharacterized protein n=1 Tax=Trachymyrmex septentrionalis TaxID=34720 RepID=A0A195F9Q1_9HYME|nr:hypothetical protein ALC56_08570 [Trachymyrmex septentrionalis]
MNGCTINSKDCCRKYTSELSVTKVGVSTPHRKQVSLYHRETLTFPSSLSSLPLSFEERPPTPALVSFPRFIFRGGRLIAIPEGYQYRLRVSTTLPFFCRDRGSITGSIGIQIFLEELRLKHNYITQSGNITPLLVSNSTITIGSPNMSGARNEYCLSDILLKPVVKIKPPLKI